jgi:hypothetical protein
MRFLSICLAAVCAAAAAMPASAVSLTIYTSRDAFMAAIHGAAVDTFDDLSATQDLPTELTRTVGDYTYQAHTDQPGDTLYPIGTGADGALSNYRWDGGIRFDGITGGANAFGADFFNSDADGTTMPYTDLLLQISYDGLGSHDVLLQRDTPGTFFGFVLHDFTADQHIPMVLLYSRDPDSWLSVDDLTLGVANPAAVPEPATWALALVGFGATGAIMRRRRGVAQRLA